MRVWREDSDRNDLRARIYILKELGSGEQEVYAAAGLDEIEGRVRSWLEGFIAGDEPGSAPPAAGTPTS